MGWTDTTSHAETEDTANYLSRRRKPKRPRSVRWILVAGTVVVLAAAAVYFVFFRAYDNGPRPVEVDGQNVQHIDGFQVHAKTFVSRSQAAAFLKRIGDEKTLVSTTTKSFRGQSYIRAAGLVEALNRSGDKTRFSKGKFTVKLKTGQHYSYDLKGNQIRQQEVRVNGKLAARFLDVYHNEAPYIPAQTAAHILSQAGLKSSWDGRQMHISLTKAPQLTPVPKSSYDKVIAFGQGSAIYVPSYAWRSIDYIPLYSLDTVLHQLGLDASVSSWRWNVSSGNGSTIAAVAKASSGAGDTGIAADSNSNSNPSGTVHPLNLTTHRHRQVLAFVPFYSGNTADFKDALGYHSSYNALAEDIWTIDASGDLTGAAPAGTTVQASSAGYSVYAMITNLTTKGFSATEMTAVLSNSVNRTRLHNQLLKLVQSKDYAGVMLDFESIPPSNEAAYSRFVSSLAAALHAEGKRLEVAVPALTGASQSGLNGAYNLAKIGQAADEVVVMAYDYSYFGGPAGPIAPIPWVQQVLAYTISEIPSSKVVLGLDAYGYDWSGKHTTAVSLKNVSSFVKKRHIQPQWNKSAEAPWFQWTDSKGNVHTVYYENGKSTSAKLDLASTYGAGGVAVWRAGLEDNAVLNALAKYK
ncbi:glycosyl hydrolase family 18 protein [Alicyclobacillus sp. SO9]|uniref:glycosyl hydrolase family 18 protein n=1 Tax=Alicyclobacillus sp. SO9 TaxID=2665646 RepID=UPI0018E78E8A|nr:glycosyl hydrolase family 18 protein [Alicyclobacillus sp. SO9]QQE80662.1 hypothetical protein GI364_09830 [Alicyclobacillus sp. SO9]